MKSGKKLSLLAVTALLGMGLLSGCGKVTPADIAKDVVKSIDKVKSIEGNMNLDFSGKISDASQPGISIDMSMKLDMDYQMTQEPEQASYMKGNFGMSAMTMNFDFDMEAYTVKGDDGFESYILANDTWTKSTAEDFDDQSESLLQKELFEAIAKDKFEVELEDKLDKVNDKDVYVMHITMDGDYLDSLFSLYGEMFDGVFNDDIDLKDAKAAMDLYVYKDAKVPAKAVIDCKDLTNSLMQGSESSAGVSVDDYVVTITMDSYNTVEPIKVPSEALKNAVDATEGSGDLFGGLEDGLGGDDDSDSPDDDLSDSMDEAPTDAAGNYIIANYENTQNAVIPVPADYEYTYSSQNYISFESDAYDTTIDYSFEDYTTMDEMGPYYSDNSYLKDDEDYTNIQETPETTVTIGDKEVHYTSVSYTYMEEYNCVDCSAWIESPDGTPFLVEISFFPYDEETTFDLSQQLQLAFSNVSFGTGDAL